MPDWSLSVGADRENERMRFFISSVIGGYRAERDAAVGAVRTLRHEAVTAEDFSAGSDSPQTACLSGVRGSDAVVLLLGARYGEVQASGLSATHEEYREARGSKYVMAFTQTGVSPEPQQQEFIKDVQTWESGHFTESFGSPEELHAAVTRGVHEFLLLNESAPLNEEELLQRAAALLPDTRRSSETLLAVAVAPGPVRAVLRPAELEDRDLARALQAEALTGEYAVLTTTAGTTISTRGDALELTQPDANRLVRLDESGRLLVVRRAVEHERGQFGMTSLIEEDVRDAIAQALRFSARVLDRIDSVNRLSHVAVMAAVTGVGYLPWRTRQEQAESPNRATMGPGSQEQVRVSLTPAVRRRAALSHQTNELAEDLTVRLRREVRG
jgi:hypothetical protein